MFVRCDEWLASLTRTSFSVDAFVCVNRWHVYVTSVRRLLHCFLDEAADVRQACDGSARADPLELLRVGVQANYAGALVRLNAGGGHLGTNQL